MDLDRLKRAHIQEPGNTELHARYIKEGLRCGHFNNDRVALAAFIKHKPSEIVFQDMIVGDGKIFLWFDIAMWRDFPYSILRHLHRWGSKPEKLISTYLQERLNLYRVVWGSEGPQKVKVNSTAKIFQTANAELADSVIYEILLNILLPWCFEGFD